MSVIAVHLETTGPGKFTDPLASYLERCGHVLVRGLTGTAGPDVDVVLVWSEYAASEQLEDQLLTAVAGGTRVLLLGPTLAAWRDAHRLLEVAGVIPGAVVPAHPTRVRAGNAGQVAIRAAGDLELVDAWPLLDKVADDTDVLLTANVRLVAHPVATARAGVGTFTLGSRAEVLADPAFQLLVHRVVRHLTGAQDARPSRLGILGYGAIGHEHNKAIQSVPGLELAAICDTNPERITAARELAPEVAAHADAEALIADDGVDLVIVSTWPSTHAEWALAALRAGKHVVVEKPFSLTTAEADQMVAAAAEGDRTLAVYQNRRWDSDYLALKRIVRSGAIGEVFHYESFIGSYGHPCNFWHSDEGVSGGAIYDWGSHYLDWMLDLVPGEVEWVSATTQKRVWHDVSNADHSVVRVRFDNGVDAEFTHSDIAAAMKPKWYVLGTEGAAVGTWRTEKVVARNAIGTLEEDLLAVSDSPARLNVHAADGSVTEVAIPPAPAHAFHRELAEHLLSGAPMSVTPQGSRRNISVMEAATESARSGGRPVMPR
ncbi:MAG: scyllo-inositol 2-dehydrogenase [Frankiaceae bacterium]|nr:scyllo-inositol 2-dehydrogenase [Frankiaceae bacterium]